MSIDVLICSLNKGIVRVDEVMLPPRSDVHYIVSYQYTDERYLDLIPESLSQREDVTLYKYNGQGLSANRNLAMEKSTAEFFMYADDDTHFTEDTFNTIFEIFKKETNLDIEVDEFLFFSETISPNKERHVLNLFFKVHRNNKNDDNIQLGNEAVLTDLKFVTKDELKSITIYPNIKENLLKIVNGEKVGNYLGSLWND